MNEQNLEKQKEDLNRVDIKDYLHLYLGSEVLIESESFMNRNVKDKINETLVGIDINGCVECKRYTVTTEDVKLILRPLSSMTEEEAKEVIMVREDNLGSDPIQNLKFENRTSNGFTFIASYKNWADQRVGFVLNGKWFANEFQYLLSKGFDLFNLIESGLAIDATKLHTP